jgi:hypothetical protein
VFGNAASFVALRVGGEDGPLLAQHLGLEPQIDYSGMGSRETSPAKLLETLPNFHAYARTLIDQALRGDNQGERQRQSG